MEDKNKVKDSDGTRRDNASGRSEAEIKYSTLFEQSPYGILLIDTEGKILDFNETAHCDLGYTREEFADITIADINPVETSDDVKARISRILEKGSEEFKTRHRTKHGEIRDVHVITKALVLSGQTVCHSIWRDITDQKAADKKVEYLAAILEHYPDAVCSIDTEGNIVSWNEGGKRMLGYRADEIIGRPIQTIIPEEKVRQEMEHCIGELNKRGFFTGHESVRVAKDGRSVPVEISGLAIKEGPKITGYASIMRDLTERKRAEESLGASQKLLNTIIESAPIGIKLITADGTLQSMNRAGLDMIEADSLNQVKGLCVYPLVSGEYREAFKALTQEVFKGGSGTLEFRMTGLKGRPLWLYTHAVPLRDEKGEVVSVIASTVDITLRKKVEQMLRESEELYRSLIETTSAAAWEVELATLKFNYISPQIAAISGFPPKQWSDFSFWAERIHPEDRDYACSFCKAETAKGLDHSFEYRICTADNRTVWIRDVVSVIKENEIPVRLRGYLFDITESKLAEEKIRQSEAFIRNILDAVDEGFIVIDRGFRILTINKAYCNQVGSACDDAIGRHCYEVSHKILRPCYEEGEDCPVLHVFETGEPYASLHKHKDAKGSIIYVEAKAFPIKDSKGVVTAAIETVNNITEKYLLEEEQLKTQKLEAIGLLAGGIAHDFNNLLQGVFGYISMAKIQIDQKEKTLQMLEQAEKALHMSVNLTSQLLTFSKGGKPLKKKIHLRQMIENSVKFALSGSRVDYSIEIDKAIRMVEADEGQLGQVIQNIVLNADQAMPLGGTIAITAKNVSVPDKGLPALLPEGNYVEISVKDNGSGIPEQYLPRLFDPYFTTKERGSGLGLATSYSIIKNHGGLISVKSELGKGSIFSVYLPALEAEEERVETIPVTADTVRKGRVLVMDDEEVVRTISKIMIGSLGHEVEFAENGEEAIAKYREALSSGKRFDIVILDLTIRGGMGGEEALRELLVLDPEVKAVVSSGYSDSEAISECKSLGFSACLAKPYEVDALRDVLNVLLK